MDEHIRIRVFRPDRLILECNHRETRKYHSRVVDLHQSRLMISNPVGETRYQIHRHLLSLLAECGYDDQGCSKTIDRAAEMLSKS